MGEGLFALDILVGHRFIDRVAHGVIFSLRNCSFQQREMLRVGECWFFALYGDRHLFGGGSYRVSRLCLKYF